VIEHSPFLPFHFLRPWWLLALLPCLALTLLLWRARSSGASWRRAIAPELLEHLLDAQIEQRQRWAWWLAFAGWLITCFALAGPTWEKLPQPVLQNREAVVLVLDLSLSMMVEDVQPSRLQRARYKIIDMLAKRKEGLTGLVVYSGDAHVVTPLTDDTATITNLVPALAPDMMPVYGSDVVSGIEQAQQLLQSSGVVHGRIVLLTDGIETDDIAAIAKRLSATRHDLSILGIGTETGAPIPASGFGSNSMNGGFIKQSDGSIAIPQLHRERLQQLAQKTGGIYRDLSVDDADLNTLLPATMPDDSALRMTERQFDQWRERGPWLIILLLPLAALAFRRGWLLIVFVAVLAVPASPSHAAETASDAAEASPQNSWSDRGQKIWRNLWTTPDQQAAQDLAHGDAKAAAEKFSDPAWRASALYRANEYEKAAQSFQTLRDDDGNTSADADYNRGNALAHAGQLQDALAAYDAALKKNPQLEDAKANRKVVEQLLKQQQESQPDKKPSDQDKKDAQSDSSKSDSSQSSKSQSDKTKSDSSTQEQSKQDESKQDQSKQRQSQSDQKSSGQDQPNKSQSEQKDTQSAANQDRSKQEQSTTQQPDAQKASAANPSSTDQKPSDADKQKIAGAAESEKLTPEQLRQQQAMEQWLRQIPDDPAGLLRRKFDYEHRQKMGQQNPNTNKPVW